MIAVDFLQTQQLLGFRMVGHAGYAEEGSDIVCAAVSSAAYMAANTLTEILKVKPKVLHIGEAECFLRVEETDGAACQAVLQGLELHIKELAKQYPAYIRVGTVRL